MIELTTEQLQALGHLRDVPPRVVNPHTQETFVLLPLEEYRRLTEEYDDSPWTPEEMEILAWRAGTMIGWDQMTEYDEDET